jgi:hypothetical protein
MLTRSSAFSSSSRFAPYPTTKPVPPVVTANSSQGHISPQDNLSTESSEIPHLEAHRVSDSTKPATAARSRQEEENDVDLGDELEKMLNDLP